MSSENINPAIRKNTGRNPDGTFPKGVSGNPLGRPKNTLKDYVRQKFMIMSDEEKEEFLKKVNADTIWKMGEGNPDTKTELTGADGKDLFSNEEKETAKKAIKEITG